MKNTSPSKDQELFEIQDKLLSQDRWCVFLIVLGMIAIGTFIWQVNEINNLYNTPSCKDISYQKKCPKQELQAGSQNV